MLNAFTLENGQLSPLIAGDSSKKAVWLDLAGGWENQLQDMVTLIESDNKLSNINLLKSQLLKRIAKSNQWVVHDEQTIYFKLLLINAQKPNKTENLIIVLSRNCILTLRESHSPLFTKFDSPKHFGLNGAGDLLLAIFNHLLDWHTGLIQQETGYTEQICQNLFDRRDDFRINKSRDLRKAAIHIGHTSHFSMKIQQCLESIQRALQFLTNDTRCAAVMGPEYEQVKKALENLCDDTNRLQGHAGYIIQNLNYMSQTSLNMLSVNQNNIVRFIAQVLGGILPAMLVFITAYGILHLTAEIIPFDPIMVMPGIVILMLVFGVSGYRSTGRQTVFQ